MIPSSWPNEAYNMTAEPIRSAHKLRPFKPFAIIMASGEKYHVPHPEMMSQSSTGDLVIVLPSGDKFFMIDAGAISEISYVSERQA